MVSSVLELYKSSLIALLSLFDACVTLFSFFIKHLNTSCRRIPVITANSGHNVSSSGRSVLNLEDNL